jgi:hypothetical protein
MRTTVTAIAPIDRDWQLDRKRARVIRAAVDWVYNQNCSNALMELEDSVTEFYGIEIGKKPPRQDR